MKSLPTLEQRFPARELEIRRLCARNSGFCRACADYAVAVKALQHWQCIEQNEVRAAEYRQLADEIADEIEALLDAASVSGKTGPKTGDSIYKINHQQER